MNGLTLRINPSNKKKVNNGMKFAPIALPANENIGTKYQLFDEFLKSSSADEQLGKIRSILEINGNSCDPEVLRFLSLVFLQADAKHPVKCFITRQITKNEDLQQPFAEKLSKEIKNLITCTTSEYPQYINVVSKVATCIENFPAGALAFEFVEIELAEYLESCLGCCIRTLREGKLSPTEKNEVFSLSHLALRLLLYIVQKINDNNATILISMFKTFRSYIEYLMFDGDTPMDTTSFCGIIYLTMELLEKGPDTWIKILEPTDGCNMNGILQAEAGQLSLCAAIATVVPADRIQEQVVGGRSAILCLIEEIVAIGERSSSESAFILGVARTILQLSKMLDKMSDKAVGSALMDDLLAFVWGHLEHYMDSVRHLAAQALANVVRYCTNMHRKGDDSGLNQLFSALSDLDKARKSYYVSLTCLTSQLGAARVLQRLPTGISDVIHALHTQAVQASATTALEMLLQKHSQESNTATIYAAWIVPALAHAAHAQDSAVLSILENLMAQAVAADEELIHYLLPHIKESCATYEKQDELKCILMIVSVARKSGVASKLCSDSPDDWKGMISYDVLRRAAVDAVEETRVLSLSLIAESPKSTEVYSVGDLNHVLYYLRYNINAQSPNFRQHTLSLMKKFIKRLEDSYKVLRRTDPGEYYLAFMDQYREACFASLIPGANYSRRFVALQLLAWTGTLHLEGYTGVWKEEYVDTLLILLEDSYENNKALALQVLDGCPAALLKIKKYRVSLEMEDILREASSMKPTDCVSAAYKLEFLTRKLPDHILQGNACEIPEPVLYTLLKRLLSELQSQLVVCNISVVLAARRAPMYGVLHCMGHALGLPAPGAISEDPSWRDLIANIISTCVEVNASVACVVNNDSPEGHLPMDAGIATTDHGNSGDVRLEDGRPVTAQMVLLCAWRSVKEVSLLLGTISSRLTIAGEGQDTGTLSHQQMALIGEHFTKLLAETKHRGAFEQAYVGFTRLLTRLWRCRSAPLHGLPRAWLRALTRAVHAPQPTRSATRRSAGLPFMIQALVTTELQVQGNSKCLHECMTTLLRLARSPTGSIKNNSEVENNKNGCDQITTEDDLSKDVLSQNDLDSYEDHIESLSEDKDSAVETRTHSLNILRALFRNSALEEGVAGHVGEGLMVALTGFEGDTWMERNSSTLLFSALMVRVFGVTRSRGGDAPAHRNTMTGRIFFLRYPKLYDFILNKLTEAVSTIESHLHPSLFPILVLLGRLYPSSLEGCGSSLRLRTLAVRVCACAAARTHAARALAAAAAPPLHPHTQYVPLLESMFSSLQPGISHNYWHGVLLQIIRLLERAGGLLGAPDALAGGLRRAAWALRQAGGPRPCYVIADEYAKLVNLVVWRYPYLTSNEALSEVKGYLEEILFTDNIPPITLGREVCLANCIYLYFVILNKIPNLNDLYELILKGLKHKTYEVVLSTLNYLLILHKKLEIDNCKFQQHLATIDNENVMMKLRETTEYIEILCKILHSNKYPECLQKTLRVLNLENNTQKYVVGIKIEDEREISDEELVRKLFDCIENEHENLTHIYLESLSNFVSEKLKDCSISTEIVLEVIRVVFACSSSDNSDSTRSIVAGFMERNFRTLLELDLGSLSDEKKFEFRATVWATMVTILEDDDESIRQRTSDVIAMTSQAPGVTSSAGVIPARAAEMLRGMVAGSKDSAAIYVLLALLDFKSEVCMTDEISDECRVFDQNERYNIFLEECVWSSACADEILKLCERTQQTASAFVTNVLENHAFANTFDQLCNDNVTTFKKMIKDKNIFRDQTLNPKIEVFISKLCI